jgi:hypothetical protein
MRSCPARLNRRCWRRRGMPRGSGSLMAGEIFISYRRADEAWARLLHTLLQAEGAEAWYDA